MQVGDDEINFSIEEANLLEHTTYTTRSCIAFNNCAAVSNDLDAKSGKLILQLFFTSDTFTGEDFVDFSTEYGKIVYIDSKGKSQDVEIIDAVNHSYNGNYMYIEVPDALQNASEIRLVYTVRNRKYVYRVK